MSVDVAFIDTYGYFIQGGEGLRGCSLAPEEIPRHGAGLG